MSIYLDHNATSPMHAPVIDAMPPFLQNPVDDSSSLHSHGRQPRESSIGGGERENGRSDGTENAAGSVGLGKAAQLPRLEMAPRRLHLERCGSACQGAVTEPGHGLQATGADDNPALDAIRIGSGMENSLQDVDKLVSKLEEPVDRLPAAIRRVAV